MLVGLDSRAALPDGAPVSTFGTEETALALVRSRRPESLVNGVWTPQPVDPDGRATAAGTELSALASAARSAVWPPWQLQGVPWAASGALTVDDDTSARELVSLATVPLGPVEADQPVSRRRSPARSGRSPPPRSHRRPAGAGRPTTTAAG